MNRRSVISVLAAVSFMALPVSHAFDQEAVDQDRVEDAPRAVAELSANDLTDIEALTAFLDDTITPLLDSFKIPGAAVAVVHEGELLVARGYGLADVVNEIPVDPEITVVRAGSISKLFTWTAVMQLVEAGSLDLDTDVNEYLEDFQIPDTFEEPVTLEHLLTHTAGFEDGGLGWLFTDNKENLVPLGEFLEEHMPARFNEPGEFSTYSNWGTALAGHIVATVSGQSWDDYVDEHILGPLGMDRSTFREPLPENLAADRAIGYTFDGEGFQPGYFQYLHNIGPAGSLSTTVVDMAKFMIAHLDNGRFGENRIMRDDTAELMHQTHFTHDPRMPGMAYGFMESRSNGLRVLGHAGSTTFFHGDLQLLPEKRTGWFVSFNAPGGNVAIDVFRSAFIDRFFPAENEARAGRVPKQQTDPRKVVGRYKALLRAYSTWVSGMFLIADDIVVRPVEDGNIAVSSFGQQTVYEEIAPLLFQAVDGDEVRAFRADENGNVTHMFDSKFSAVAVEKIPWFESVWFHKRLWLFVTVLAFTALIAPLRVWRRGSPGSGGRRTALILAVAGGAMVPLFYWLFVSSYMAAGHEVLIVSIPIGVKLALTIPLVIAGCTACLAILVAKSWLNDQWPTLVRVQYSLITLGFLAFLWSVNYWNLLGYKFG